MSINLGVVCLANGFTLYEKFLLCSITGKGTSLRLLFVGFIFHFVFGVLTFGRGVWIADAYKGKLN